jgi:hypothetical protein
MSDHMAEMEGTQAIDVDRHAVIMMNYWQSQVIVWLGT